MAQKEGKIFIEVVCANCGTVVKDGWSYRPAENEKTTMTRVCPTCKMPVKVEFIIN